MVPHEIADALLIAETARDSAKHHLRQTSAAGTVVHDRRHIDAEFLREVGERPAPRISKDEEFRNEAGNVARHKNRW
jgi:hypothetical protein